jgi:uncharacterized membrane protein
MMFKRFAHDNRTQLYAAWVLLILLMLAYALDMSLQTIWRYETFKATAFDLGNLDQVMWNTIHGRWFEFTNRAIDYFGPPTRLAVHFEPIIVPLSLLYVFGADPRILLVFQTLVLVVGALPVFLLTRHFLPQWPLLAPAMAFAYLLSPALLGVNLFDFHPVSLATPALLFALLALTHKRYGWFLLACLIAAASKEDVPFVIGMLGILLIWKYKLPRLGTLLLVGGFLWGLIAFEVIIPHFYPGAQSNNFIYRYAALGNSPSQIILNLLLHPWLIFTTFFTLDRLYYLIGLFRSTGFLSLLAPEWLLGALPNLAVNLLSTDSLTYSGVYHYNAAIIPFVMFSAIQGTRRLTLIWQRWRGESSACVANPTDAVRAVSLNAEGARMLAATAPRNHLSRIGTPFAGVLAAVGDRLSGFASALPGVATIAGRAGQAHVPTVHLPIGVASGLERAKRRLEDNSARQWQGFSERMIPLAKSIALPRLQWIVLAWIVAMALLNFLIAAPELNIFWADHAPDARDQHINQLLSLIPPTASVSASDNLNPHVSERQGLAVFPQITYDTPTASNVAVQYIVVDLDAILPEDRVSTANELDHLERSGQYIVVTRAEGVVLLRLASLPQTALT